MSGAVRVAHEEASAVALALVSTLRPACERIEIAGSLRREADTVGDIELVTVPKVHAVTEPDGLFSTRTRQRNVLTELLDELIGDGSLIVHPDDPKRGERYAKLLHVASGLQLDLFSVLPPAQFGMIYLIRTGPAEYGHRLMSHVRARGFHVGAGALHETPIPCARRISACVVVPTPEEADVFDRLGIRWVAPEERR